MSAKTCQGVTSILNYVTLNEMKRRKKPVWLLVIGSLFLVLLIYILIFFSPKSSIVNGQWSIDVLPFFFILTFSSFFFLFSFFLSNFRRGLFIGLFVSAYFLLRFLNLTHIFFLIMLLIVFITLELFFSYKK